MAPASSADAPRAVLRQRNRIHFELAVPSDLAQTRLATNVAAGGRLLDESEDRWRVADPEGNEMVIVSRA